VLLVRAALDIDRTVGEFDRRFDLRLAGLAEFVGRTFPKTLSTRVGTDRRCTEM
jgi:hypothetical protein